MTLPRWIPRRVAVITSSVLGAAMLTGFASSAVRDEAGAELVRLLSATEVRAKVDDALADRYEERDEKQWADIALNENELWPAVMGDASFLLEDGRWKEVRDGCRRVRRSPPASRNPLERLVLQQRLWTAFDHLFLDGVHPHREAALDSGRWHAVLYELAQTIRFLALTREEIAGLPSGAGARRALLGDDLEERAVEIYSLEGLPLHDGVARYRTYSRVYCYDASRDLRAADLELLGDLTQNGWRMPVGSMAVLERNAMAVTADGVLYPTDVTLSLSSYTVESAGDEGRRQCFAYAALDPRSGQCAPGDYLPYADDAEAWSSLNLPSVPPMPGIGRRVPIWDSCTDCHGGATMGLSTTVTPRKPELLRVVPPDGVADREYLGERIVNAKRDTAEFFALSAYMEMDEASGANLAARSGSSLLGSGRTALWRLGIATAVLLVGLALGAGLARRGKVATG